MRRADQLRPLLTLTLTLTLTLAVACRTPEKAPTRVVDSSTGPLDAAVSALADRDASIAPEAGAGAGASTPKVAPRLLEVNNGTFAAAQVSGKEPRAVRARVLPSTVIAPDQRASGAIDASGDDPGVELPISQLGVYQEKGVKSLALVEARQRPTVPAPEKPGGDPVDAALVAWFVAGAEHRLHSGGGAPVAWRLWEGEPIPAAPAVLLTVEDARGQVVAARFLGPQSGVRSLEIDATTPLFLATLLANGSGIDDGVTLAIIGFIGGELRQLLAVDAGPTSAMNCTSKHCDVLGPVGSVDLVREHDAAALRVRRVVASSDEPCTPGHVSNPGCNGEELTVQWNAAEKRLAPGPATRIVLQQTAPGRPVTVKRTGP
jgi:hypothetical protein